MGPSPVLCSHTTMPTVKLPMQHASTGCWGFFFFKIKPEMLGKISRVPPGLLCCSQGTRKQQFLFLSLELLGWHGSSPALL